MLSDVVGCLACPVCGAPFALAGPTLCCGNGHSYDVARQGYVNLLRGDARPTTADTTAMVAARETFLTQGWFAPLAEALAAACADVLEPSLPGCVAEVGAGTAYYLAAVLAALPGRAGLALDLSKAAAKRAAGAHERIGAAVADTWCTLPVADGAVCLLLDVFAPRNATEFRRVLTSGGILAVVTPTVRHLRPLVSSLGLVTVEEEKHARLEASLGGVFERVSSRQLEWEMRLPREAVRLIVGMGPSARHVPAEDLERRLAALEPVVDVTASVVLGLYRAC